MSRTAIVNARVLTREGVLEGRALLLDGPNILGLCKRIPDDFELQDCSGLTIVPGFIDVQVNGGGGRLFNDDPSADTVACMASAHRRYGTTGLLPTLISDDLDIVEQAIKAVDEAIEAGVPGVIGIHLEGPYLAPARKGAHRADKLRVLEDRHIPLLLSSRRGLTHITLAPECVTTDQIRQLRSQGAIVSLGHSGATCAEAAAALDAGATGFTHLFNAMSQMTSREPGMVGAALGSAEAFCGIIADGEHVHPTSLMVAFRGLGPERLMLVTDAMSLAGTELSNFELQGRKITKRGDALLTEEGTLAGSALTMIAAVRRISELPGLSFEEAVAMASATPAKFLGLSAVVGRIKPGQRANLVALDERHNVAATWIAASFQAH